jgi:FkbM family methyltransferase
MSMNQTVSTLSPRLRIRPLLYRALLKLRPAPLANFCKKTLRIKRVVVDSPVGRFWIDPVSEFGSHFSMPGGYETEWTAEIDRWTKRARTFVDIGANEGYYSVIAARNGARVLAVEPQERLHKIIGANAKLNDLTSIDVVNCAISDRSGTGEIYLSNSINPGASGFVRVAAYRLPKAVVKVETLQNLLSDAGLGAVDVMKIDIEGYEYEAILGSPDLFRQHRIGALFIEMHPDNISRRGLDPKDIDRFLVGCGYIRNDTAWLSPHFGLL